MVAEVTATGIRCGVHGVVTDGLVRRHVVGDKVVMEARQTADHQQRQEPEPHDATQSDSKQHTRRRLSEEVVRLQLQRKSTAADVLMCARPARGCNSRDAHHKTERGMISKRPGNAACIHGKTVQSRARALASVRQGYTR